MSEEIYLNLFKAKENEIGIIYENGSFEPADDFTFKAGVPYQLGLKKQTSAKGTEYISVRAVVNKWAIENKPEYSHLKIQNEVNQSMKEQSEDLSNVPF